MNTNQPGVPLRATVIDDEPFMRSILKRVLQRRGYEVSAYSGPTEYSPCKVSTCPCQECGKCPDIILTDVDMASIEGVEAIKNLMRLGCKCAKIAMISGNWTQDIPEEVLPLGVSVFAKPFSLESLHCWLDKVEKDLRSAEGGGGTWQYRRDP